MKAKKLMGMIACAGACVSLSALANTTNGWFGVTVDNGNVTTANISKNDVGVVDGTKITLTDVEQTSALVFTPNPNAPTNRNDGIYVIGASVALTPCSVTDLNGTDGAKVGIVVGIDAQGKTNYYGYASGEEEKWVKLEGAAVVDPGQDTAFSIVLNYRDNTACYVISENEEDKWFGPYGMASGSSAPVDIRAWGTGSISSVTGGYEVAEAAYNGNKYGSVAEAMGVAGIENYNNIAVVNESGSAESGTGADTNGLQKWQNKAMGIEPDAQVGLDANTDKQNSGMITLAAVLPDKEDGVAVGFDVYRNNTKVGGTYDADNIQIPMGNVQGTETYTIVPVITTK